MQTREPLTKDRVLSTAVALADANGIEAVTMRRLAEELDVEAMSLYHHLPNKEAILDGVVDLVFAEIAVATSAALPARTPAEWKAAVRRRILAARSVLLRHPWAPDVIESRSAASFAMALHMDGIVGALHAGGLSYDLIHHGLHALGSRAMGFVQELGDSDDTPNADELAQMAAAAPNLAAMLAEVVHDDPGATLGWCDDQTEFEFGLDLILDGLERKAAGRVADIVGVSRPTSATGR
jgi:AcrR family transcriptional regulator